MEGKAIVGEKGEAHPIGKEKDHASVGERFWVSLDYVSFSFVGYSCLFGLKFISVGRPCWSEVVVYHLWTALSELGAVWKTPSSPVRTSCSLPYLIWKMSLGPDA